ncbi:hypothetical protein ACLKA6_013862 [Drosophila palustris]
MHPSKESRLEALVERFWELEAVPELKDSAKYSPEQLACEKSFKDNVRNLSSGRFEVSLPFKIDPKILGSSFETAKRRFLSLERRVSKDLELKEMYVSFMKEYIDLGHMSVIGTEVPPGPHYVIPHQCVLRPDSSSTKLRVVFDASCKTTSDHSLNDLLMVGPTIQRELILSLLRFRLNRYALTADIRKMYRQVSISDDDRRFQLIVWRENPSDELKIYRLNTVTYGTASAPFLAIRCLQELGLRHKDTHVLGSEVICNDFYVDDMLTGADNLDTLKAICAQVSEILNSGGFQLAKWFSNHPNLIEEGGNEKLLSFNDTDSTKTLGMRWTPSSDTFRYYLDDCFTELSPTKRNILSVAARMFDPLGLLSPISIRAKILLQELWRMQLPWDDTMPMEMHSRWEKFKENLLELHKIAIPSFIARRGVPSRIYSDNATNFVGTNNLLRELQEAFERQRTSLQSFAAEKGMEWCFIPPRAPHFGGLWEAAVKSAKHLLLRQIGSASLVESEVRGHLADVEAILNSRPLTPLSGDPNDGEALTPGHLLIGQPLRSLPQGSEPDTPSSGISCSRRWQLLSMLRQRFWRAWSKDYVHSLQSRGKWTAEQPNLAIGALVVIHEDNTPPQRWTTGRIVEVVPGADGRIRVADVKTAVGVCRRPIHKLAVLPIV